jgi:dTDP-glucose pyrophosphorylase
VDRDGSKNLSVPPIGKAVILARGLGTRMRRPDKAARLDPLQSTIADSGVKAMIPIGRPFLDYVLSALADAGYREVCLVIGPEHQAVRDYYTVTAPPKRTRVLFATQANPLGTADAVLAAAEFAAGEDFLVINSDNYYPLSALAALRALPEQGTALFEREGLSRKSNIPPERIRAFAVCSVGADGYLQRILEKPDEAALRAAASTSLVSMNCWRFSSSIFRACRATPLSSRGEFELPQAVQYAITRLNERFRVVPFEEAVLDLSTRADIGTVAERLRNADVRP